MTSKIVLLALFSTIMTFAQSKTGSNVFASLKGDNFLIVGDTIKLKNEIVNLMFSDYPQKPNLNVTIRKGSTIGEKVESYYFVNLQSDEQNINVTKWLERIGDDLVIIEAFSDDNYWQVLTTACIGKEDCLPQVAIIDGAKSWSCGTKLVCSKEETNCKRISAIQTD